MKIVYRLFGVPAVAGVMLAFQSAQGVLPPNGNAPVDPPPYGFAIDGDLMANVPELNVGDWITNTNLAPGTGGSVMTLAGLPINTNRTFHLRDPYNGSDNAFKGGMKWRDNPNLWQWTSSGKPSSKTDINNALLHITSDTNGHVWVVVAADRLSTAGSSYIDFEFLQSSLTLNSNNFTFTSAGTNGGRTVGDLLFSLAFTGGGSTPEFLPYRWQANGAGGFDYMDATAMLPVGRYFMGVNTNTISVPYGAFGQTSYAPNAFAEAAIDLTALLGNFDQCASFGFKTILVKTKSSTSDTSSIEDFITPFQYTLRIGPDAQAGSDQLRCTEGSETVFPLAGTAASGLSSVSSATWSVLSGNATIDNTNALVTTAHVSSTSATLRLTVVQANGCTQTDDVVLTVQQPPTCAITGVTNTCPRTTNSFSAAAGMNSYLWTVAGNGSISGPANQQTVKVVAGQACGTNYTLTISAVSNVCSVSCSTDVAVIDNGAPVLTCPPDRILNCTADTRTNATGVATATDSCSRATVTYSDSVVTGCGVSKVITRTWTATDECGNAVSCAQTITVQDITPPVITCPANRTLEFPADISTNANGMATATDVCSTPVVTYQDVITTNCGNTFVVARTWTATDACGNNSSCTQTITVRDTTAPVITCPASVTLECPAITTTNATGVATSTDAGGKVTITYSDTTTANCGDTYTISRRWTATDSCNNSSSCTQTITVRDTTPPGITCPGDVTLEYPAVTTTNVTGVATATDTCNSVTIAFVDSVTNACGGTKTIARRWTATDPCGNSSSCTQIISVRDTTAPAITIPGNLTLDCPANTATSATGTATATDANGNPTVTYVDSITANCGNSYVISRRWTATDICGNATNRTQTITVRDITAPVITIPPSVTLDCPADTSTNNTGVATAVDACGSAVVTFTDSVVNNCGNTKTISRTWRATDQCGNSSTGVQIITVRDLAPPVLTYPADRLVECGASTAPSATGNATAVDACNAATVSYSDSISNACGGTRVISRLWTATDTCGNSTNAVQKITVRDTTPPSLVLPANRVLDCPGDTRTNVTGVATAVDVCGSVSLTYSDIVVSNGCGATFTMQRRWTAVDQCGNSTNGVQTIIVQDKTPPTISLAPIKVQCVGDVPAAHTTLTSFRAAGGTVNDSCDADVAFSLVSDSGLVGSCPGTVTRVYRVTDDCGNFANATHIITVDDTIAPAITCAGNATIECGDSMDPAILGSVTATDNCDTNVSISYSDVAIQSTYDVNWYAADPAANSAPYLPTYLKLAPGSLPCPTGGRATDPLRNAVAFGPTPGQLDALTSLAGESMSLGQILPFEAVIDVSGGPGPERGTIEFTTSWSTYTTSNDRFGFDKNYRVYCAFVDSADIGSIDPHANAKVESFSSTIINVGTIDEKIQGTFRVSGLDPGDRVIVEVWMVLMSTQPDHVGGTIASDLVSAQKVLNPPQPISVGAKTISISAHKFDPLPSPQEQPPLPPLPPQPPIEPGIIVSVIDRTWAATDDCGNRDTCVQRITVRDATAPTLTVPADLILEYPAAPTTNNTGVATALDGCGSVTISYSDIVSNGCGGATIIWRTWTATDQSNNSTNAVQRITVLDTAAPTLTCPPNTTVELGASTSTNATGVATATDSSGAVTISFTDTVTGGCGNTGIISRRWTALDACGNTAVCTQTITIADTTLPTIACPPNRTVECGSDTSTNATGVAAATDAAGAVTISFTDTFTDGCGDTGIISRRWTALDACGNSAVCTQTITIVDTTAPMLSTVPSKTITAGNPLAFNRPVALDTCGSVTMTIVSTTTNLLSDGMYSVTRIWKAVDACGNESAQQSQTITVIPPPVTKLEISMVSNPGILLRWPTNAADYRLEWADTCNAQHWYPVTITPIVTNGECRVYTTRNAPARFFRLANTPPALEMLRTAPGKMTLTWPTAPSGFILESSTSLTSPNWTPMAVNLTVSNMLNSVEINLSGPVRFFRLKK